MVMSGNVILSLYLPRLTSDKLEGADVVMLIVSLIVVCLLIIYETYIERTFPCCENLFSVTTIEGNFFPHRNSLHA